MTLFIPAAVNILTQSGRHPVLSPREIGEEAYSRIAGNENAAPKSSLFFRGDGS
jgi:hypothetical protein